MSLTREDVEKVALLARLQLSEQEIETLTVQLGQIVEYVDQLSELDTESVEPMAHALDIANVFAEDQPQPPLDRADALSSAPHHDGECFLVPAVLGDS